MEFVFGFEELKVYRLSRELSKDIFNISKTFPREEMYALTDQIRRSSRAIGAQIAEAWAKRKYERHFISKLTDADGEVSETLHWIFIAFDGAYLSREEARALIDRCRILARMLNATMKKSSLFCKKAMPEKQLKGTH